MVTSSESMGEYLTASVAAVAMETRIASAGHSGTILSILLVSKTRKHPMAPFGGNLSSKGILLNVLWKICKLFPGGCLNFSRSLLDGQQHDPGEFSALADDDDDDEDESVEDKHDDKDEKDEKSEKDAEKDHGKKIC